MTTKENMQMICQMAEEKGFTAAIIAQSEMVFVPEYRKFCEQNLCGSYNRNYGCPPYCGTPQQMEEKTKVYKHALVLQSTYHGINALDGPETKAMKKVHNQNSLELMRRCTTEKLMENPMAIMAGPCSLCASCKMPEGKPCPMEMARFSCLSAYCIDVNKLATAAGMEISWASDQASFYSILMF